MQNQTDIAALLKKVRRLEIRTKGLSNHIFSGAYHTAFKGRGMSFSEVRDYSFGDDIRNIDWNVTARFSSPFIKIFEEERELNLMLLVDISHSSLFGTSKRKRELITELCATLAFSAMQNNDKIGLIFFSDKIEMYIPPKKGKAHILYLIREMLSKETSKHKKTDVAEVLRYLNNVQKKRSIVFLLSDFISEDFSQALNIARKKHDVVGIQVYDKADAELPNMGLLHVEDSESQEQAWIDTGNKKIRNQYAENFLRHKKNTEHIFTKAGLSLLQIKTEDDFVKPLQLFFKNR